MTFDQAVRICNQVPRLTKREPDGGVTVRDLPAALEKLATIEDEDEELAAVANGADYGDAEADFLNKLRHVRETAQMILDARNLYPDKTLAELYDEATMPPELRAAHEANDYAVMDMYGFPHDMTEQEMAAELMRMYTELAEADGE